MDTQVLFDAIQQYGYLALFAFLWLGIVGMPIPDEVIVMSGGFTTSLGLLEPIFAFFVTYTGVISGLTVGYILGRVFGSPVIEYLSKKRRLQKYIEKAQLLIRKYGNRSLILSYFFPVVRHIVPYLVGINRMSFRTYAVFSYSAGFVWTFIYFLIGKYFGDSIEVIYDEIAKYLWLVSVLGIVIIIVMTGTKFKQEKNLNA